MSVRSREPFTLPRMELLDPQPEAKPVQGSWGRAPGGQASTHGAWPGAAWRRDMGPHSCMLTTCRMLFPHLSGGERAWASVWGWEIMTRYSWTHLNTGFRLWNQSPEEGWTMSQSRVALCERQWARVGILVSPHLAACILEVFPVDEGG